MQYVRIKQPLLPSPSFNKLDLGLLDTNKNNYVKIRKEKQKYTFVFTPECRSKSKDGRHWAIMPCSTIQIERIKVKNMFFLVYYNVAIFIVCIPLNMNITRVCSIQLHIYLDIPFSFSAAFLSPSRCFSVKQNSNK